MKSRCGERSNSEVFDVFYVLFVGPFPSDRYDFEPFMCPSSKNANGDRWIQNQNPKSCAPQITSRGTYKVILWSFSEHSRKKHIKCHIWPFWLIFISPILFDIIGNFDIFWNPQMKIIFIRNFDIFRKNKKFKVDRISDFWKINLILCTIFTISSIIFRLFKFAFRLIS